MTDEALVQEMNALGPWYQTIRINDQLTTPGKSNVESKFGMLEPYIGGMLKDATVLDLGCNAGGIAFECARRGAVVTGVESGTTFHNQSEWLKKQLDLPVTFVHDSVYGIDRLDTFDLVLFLGLIYHLRYPMYALDMVRRRCKGKMILSTKFSLSPDAVLEWQVKTDEPVPLPQEARHNWFFPSDEAMQRMMRAAGFNDIQTFYCDRPNQNIFYLASC